MLSYAGVFKTIRKHLSLHFWDPVPAEVWPLSISLRVPSGKSIDSGEDFARWIQDIRRLAKDYALDLVEEGRNIGFICAKVPVKIIIPDERVAGEMTMSSDEISWRDERLQKLRALGLAREEAADIGRLSCDYDETDFPLLLEAGKWFRENDAAGLTPRQVPIPGFNAKWLDGKGRRKLVARIAGKDDLGLRDRPVEVRMKYLDPDHRGFGLIVPGTGRPEDESKPCYPVETAIIVENKDTFLDFPELCLAVCLFGEGHAAAKSIAEIGWLAGVPGIVYWGDIDSSGFEILAEIRRSGIECKSILMDRATYDRYSEFGVDVMPNGRNIATDCHASSIDGLTEQEQELYITLKRGVWHPLRIEQERIPFTDALDAIDHIRNMSSTCESLY